MAIVIDGKDIRTVPEQVSKNTIDIENLKGRDYAYKSDVVDNLTSYQTKKPLSANQGRILKDMLNQAIAGVFKYKGSVASYAELPSSGMSIGDTYNVLDTGDNYTWDGTAWDKLSGIVDLSNFYTKSESDSKYVDLTSEQTIKGTKHFALADNQTYYGSIEPSSTGFTIGTNVETNMLAFSGYGLLAYTTLETSDIQPRIDNYYNIGSSNKRYKDLYLSGNVYYGTYNVISFDSSNRLNLNYNGTAKFKIGNTNSFIVSHLYPDTSNTYSLGSSTFKWKDLYLSGVLSDGINDVNVADLKALIVYAKNQGWIS